MIKNAPPDKVPRDNHHLVSLGQTGGVVGGGRRAGLVARGTEEHIKSVDGCLPLTGGLLRALVGGGEGGGSANCL